MLVLGGQEDNSEKLSVTKQAEEAENVSPGTTDTCIYVRANAAGRSKLCSGRLQRTILRRHNMAIQTMVCSAARGTG
ncbi:g9982 [Coccomyxa elongata]